MNHLKDQIFDSNMNFESTALKVFRFQSEHNQVYKQFLSLIGCDPTSITDIEKIPFLPIELFKTQNVYAADTAPEISFSSSGTSDSGQSKHPVADLGIYEQSIRLGFEYFYGDIHQYRFLGLLPSYLERQGSSLIYMVNKLMEWSGGPKAFHLYDHENLIKSLEQVRSEEKKPFLIGVSFALLDLAEGLRPDLAEVIVMETGGMKGRKKEIIREELHQRLCEGLQVQEIHSEYGMTELLSQAYSKGKGLFECPPWMQISIADMYDPMTNLPNGQSGLIKVIDLANLYSCSFLLSADIGRKWDSNRFEVLGRKDESDIRGCNLMVSNLPI